MAEVSLAPFARSTTGLPSTRHFSLGRVVIKVAELDTSDDPDDDGWVHLGNAPSCEVGLTRSYMDHFSSMAGVRDRDVRILIEELLDGKFTLEELTEKAAELFFAATPAAYTNVAVAGFTERELIDNVKLGRWYPITNAAGGYAFGIASADVTVEKQGSPDTALVEGTDYTLDLQTGEIMFLSTSVVIVDGDNIDVTLAANAVAETTRSIPVLSRDSVTLAMRIKCVNGRDDEAFMIVIPKVEITADGALPLVTGQELMKLPLAFAALKKDADTPLATIYALPPGGVT